MGSRGRAPFVTEGGAPRSNFTPSSCTMTLLKNLLDKWKAQSISGKLYTSGNAALMLVMGVLMTIPWTAQRALTLFMAVPLLLFMAGFLIWFVPKLLAFGRSQIGTMPIVVVSTLLAPICLGLARQFVGTVVQLPPQSFDVTVALFVVLFIPIGWGVVVGAILSFVCVVSILGVATTSSFRPLVRIFAVNPAGCVRARLLLFGHLPGHRTRAAHSPARQRPCRVCGAARA